MLLVGPQRLAAAPAKRCGTARRRRGGGGGGGPPSERPQHHPHPRPPRRLTTTVPASSSPSSSSYLDQLGARPPAAAAALTGAYALIAGAALCAFPVPTLSVLAPVAAAAMPVGFIRVGGLILATFGAQYALAAWHDVTGGCSAEAFYRASVPSRLALALGLAALVCAGQVERGVVILAALNATGALAMRRALGRV